MDKDTIVQGFLAVYDGDATRALLDLARVGGIAVHHIDRAAIEHAWGREVTDEEWALLRPHLSGYHEWLSDNCAQAIEQWRDLILPDLVGVPLAGEEVDESTPPPASPVDGRVGLTFATQGQQRTAWLEITYPEDAVPVDMLADLAAVGFVIEVELPPVTAFRHEDGRSIDLGYREITAHLAKAGADLFGGWTEAERIENMRAARAVLRRYGFVRVPVWHKRLEDML